jgi:hypothetical protein
MAQQQLGQQLMRQQQAISSVSNRMHKLQADATWQFVYE